MVRNPLTAATTKAVIEPALMTIVCLRSSAAVAAITAGMLIRKLNRNAWSAEYFLSRRTEEVIPLRDMPGRIAKPCARPE